MVQLIGHNFLVFLILEVDFSHLFHISRFLCIFMTWFRRVNQWLRSQWLQTTIAYLASKDYVITLIVMISDNSIISTTLSEFFFSISLFRLTSQSLLSSRTICGSMLDFDLSVSTRLWKTREIFAVNIEAFLGTIMILSVSATNQQIFNNPPSRTDFEVFIDTKSLRNTKEKKRRFFFLQN